MVRYLGNNAIAPVAISNVSRSYSPRAFGDLARTAARTLQTESGDAFKENCLQKWGPLALHRLLRLPALERQTFVSRDHLEHLPRLLLKASVAQLLPDDVRPERLGTQWFHLGLNQVYFRPRLSPPRLLSDGTDNRYLPGPYHHWKYRLWAGGSTTCYMAHPFTVNRQPIKQFERATKIRVVGKTEPEKVFVTIKRSIATYDPLRPTTPAQDIAQLLKPQRPYEEEYTLCFLRKRPADLGTRQAIKPPSAPVFYHTMTPNANLLFQFSALTYNAHAIHFDPLFAQREYGLKAPVVHGPLTQVLMLEFLRRALNTYKKWDIGIDLIPMHLEYTNLMPLYVGEPFQICCKPLKVVEGEELWQAEAWQIWIQTGTGDDMALAVKGSVRVAQISVTQNQDLQGYRSVLDRYETEDTCLEETENDADLDELARAT